MSIVKINVLTVPEEQRETLEKRFASRAGTVDGSDGFEWFELLRPIEGTDTYLVYTRWRAEEDFQNWMSGMGQAAHRGGPQDGSPQGSRDGSQGGSQEGSAQGERPKPAATGATLWTFEVVQQAGPKEG
ncbi:antibiotic biosynthesis monooxygenase family protein [Streptomyces sp. NPDC101776]|uniref:antibiotic biosynthesis monooxygenase family protein n=1 Tax=Streptomyces sp. NPDC101776 TaxID=3366146 RepID=UPI0038239E95